MPMTIQGADGMISRHSLETLVCGSGSSKQKKTKMRFKKGRWLQVVNKLDEDQAGWIVGQNRNGARPNRELAETFGISMRWVQKLCSKYRNAVA